MTVFIPIELKLVSNVYVKHQHQIKLLFLHHTAPNWKKEVQFRIVWKSVRDPNGDRHSGQNAVQDVGMEFKIEVFGVRNIMYNFILLPLLHHLIKIILLTSDLKIQNVDQITNQLVEKSVIVDLVVNGELINGVQ